MINNCLIVFFIMFIFNEFVNSEKNFFDREETDLINSDHKGFKFVFFSLIL